jgi:hypothetical protein
MLMTLRPSVPSATNTTRIIPLVVAADGIQAAQPRRDDNRAFKERFV